MSHLHETSSESLTGAPIGSDAVVLVYDGECGLCNASVKFVLRHDRREQIRFAAWQSPIGERLRDWAGLPAPAQGEIPPTMLLIEKGRPYTRSSAALRLARHLDWPWPLFYALTIVPRFLRDAVYNFVARNRKRWFAAPDACALPSPEVRKRFLS